MIRRVTTVTYECDNCGKIELGQGVGMIPVGWVQFEASANYRMPESHETCSASCAVAMFARQVSASLEAKEAS